MFAVTPNQVAAQKAAQHASRAAQLERLFQQTATRTPAVNNPRVPVQPPKSPGPAALRNLPAPAAAGGVTAGLDLVGRLLDPNTGLGHDLTGAGATGAVTAGLTALGGAVGGPIGAAVGSAAGGYIGSWVGDKVANSLFGDPLQSGGPQSEGPGTGQTLTSDPPFRGGQSDGVRYRVTMERVSPNWGKPGIESCAPPAVYDLIATGPIKGHRTYAAPNTSPGNEITIWEFLDKNGPVYGSGGGFFDKCPGQGFKVLDVVRKDGQPDTGGDPPGTPYVQPWGPKTTPRPASNPGNAYPSTSGAPSKTPGQLPTVAPPVINPASPGTTPTNPDPTAEPDGKPQNGFNPLGALPFVPLAIPGRAAGTQPNTAPKSAPGGSGAQPPPPSRTQNKNKCNCNKGLLDSMSGLFDKKLDNFSNAAQLGLLAKIDATTTATGAGVAANLTKLQAMQQFMETAWKATHADKIINLLTLVTTLHNAAHISRDIGETLGYVLSNGLSVIGIKDENDNPLNINELVGNSVETFIKSVVGEEVYTNTAEFWQKSNRVISSASNIVWTLRSITDASQEVAEWTAENTGKIGNALKKFGVVGDNAYPWMAERVRSQDAYRRKLTKVFDGLESVENTANSLSTVTSNVREIQQEVNELGEARQRFKDAVGDLAPGDTPSASPENNPIAIAQTEAAIDSQGPNVNINVDGARGTDP